ncbi:MAG: hypothetical protein HQL32_09955 [Planctomycetes bacterium]|nr:hypothetical protein [Planctomycetota bacterium]
MTNPLAMTSGSDDLLLFLGVRFVAVRLERFCVGVRLFFFLGGFDCSNLNENSQTLHETLLPNNSSEIEYCFEH